MMKVVVPINHFQPLLKGTRLISLSAVHFKQPPEDKRRRLRKNPPPFHTVPFIGETPSYELPKKPAIITGNWGSTDESVKKVRFKSGEQLRLCPSTFDKLQELYYLEENLWYHTIDFPLQYPGMLNFIQHLTRTKFLSYEPIGSENCPIISSYLSHALGEYLDQLNHVSPKPYDLSSKAQQSRKALQRKRISGIMEAVYRAFVVGKPQSSISGMDIQIDERATVETFMKRLVNKEIYESDETIAEDVFNSVDETILDKECCVHYRIRSELAWQLRSPYPLKPFISPTDPVCLSEEPEACNYRPEAFDMVPVDCYKFTCLPFFHTLDFDEFARSVAGYWSRTPFWEGDPCEFGVLGILDTGCSERVKREIHATALADSVKAKILEDHGLAEGLMTAFAWTSAQAYNQGFTLYNELTYPFPAQLILMDENHIQLLRFQLNSLTAYWKASDAGLPQNIAWCSPRLQLFERNKLNEDESSISLNPEVVPLLISAFSYPLETSIASKDLRPYLADGSAPRDHIVEKEKRTWLIPRFEDTRVSTKSSSSNIQDNLGSTELTEEERAAFEASELREKKKNPLRLYGLARPHPNDVFFFKLTKKSTLIQELKEDFPSFGGTFGELPQPYKDIIRDYRLQLRARQGRYRVQAPPRRWR